MVDLTTLEDQQRVAQIMGRQTMTEDPAEEALRDQIREYGRIQVPLLDSSKAALKECAALLRTLSEELRILADRHDLSQTVVLYRAYGLIKSNNHRMQETTKYSNQK